MNDLTGFQRDLLWTVNGMNDPSGLDIKSELEDYYAQEVHHGRLYPNLDTLANKGLVAKEEVDGRTNAYHITKRGERELTARKEWLEQYAGEGTRTATAD